MDAERWKAEQAAAIEKAEAEGVWQENAAEAAVWTKDLKKPKSDLVVQELNNQEPISVTQQFVGNTQFHEQVISSFRKEAGLPSKEDINAPLLLGQGILSTRKLSWKVIRNAIINGIFSLALVYAISAYFTVKPAHPFQAFNTLSSSSLETCSWKTLQSHVSLLDVPAISRKEFLSRQAKLAAALDAAGVDAFIAEPSASTSYYANVSSSFELSERPFLVLISKDGEFSYLAPKFELGRIAGLEMVYESKNVYEWKEEEVPYEVLKRETGFKKVMLDEHVRYMIAAGLEEAGVEVVGMSKEVQQLRAVKTEGELAILRGINEFTLELVRSLQKCIKIGVTQEAVFDAAEALFSRAGVGEGYWAIVLFGEQAANPHGGSLGKTLGVGEFVLIDIGSKLYDYGSDVTRTVLPADGTVSKYLWEVWQVVHASQSAAISLMKVNETCSDVDAASRAVITNAGSGEFFTHRLGHGLGLEMHEHPYLNGANAEKLKAGEVVTNEPGIYVTTEQAKNLGRDVGYGVRLEDPILVTEDGGVPLTGSRAKSPYEP
ncbi:putative peptidase [Lachnellula hyalina]|uniref:Probable Xaa-Pro aminopeptidase P n=1 Tax=Lachnellula hyalina TaxID=1316788 RepID=A0A8H8U0T7_9HELO|nr:putative peptidase [Lachnellula hyalina]TVY27670.1 putative peptidase [Lachnellula hyalina]